MKKALVLFALSLTMLSAMAANQRLWIIGYRIGDSEIMANDDHRIVATNWAGEVKTDIIALGDDRLSSNAWFFASVPKGEEVLRWFAYDNDPKIRPPSQTNNFAGAVTEYVWSYNSADTDDKYIVLDYDYITYNLKYDKNGGNGSMTNETYIYTNAFYLTSNDFSRTGYSFECWTNVAGSAFADQQQVSGASFSVDYTNKTETLYAKWRPHAYTIKFNENTSDDVSGEMPSMLLTYDVSTNLTSNAFVRVGYKFSGWAIEEDGVVMHKNGASVNNLTSDDNVVLNFYAVWAAKKFTIKYHRNDGTDETRTQGNLSFDTPTEIVSESPRTGSGYKFDGWATSDTGPVQYKAGEKYQIDPGDADIIHLYAVWSPIVYSVVFNANGGTGMMQPESFTYNLAQALASNTITRVGYTFAGWAKTAGGSVAYTDGQIISNLTTTADATVTLYAKWAANTYEVTLDKQGGSGGAESITATYDAQMPSMDKPARTGYTFGGYYTEPHGSGTPYYTASGASGQNWNISSNTTLYAEWAANSYFVKFNKKSGDVGDMGNQEFQYDVAQALSPNLFDREGYSFAGWATNSNGMVVYGDGQTVSNLAATASAVVNLYVCWTANTYTVTLNAQGGSGGSSSVNATYGSAMPSATMPTRAGYSFGGYYTEENGAGTQYYKADGTSARSWNLLSDTTLYAKWTATKYMVTLDRLGGGGGSSSVNATYGAAMPSATMPTRTGYAFDGYYSEMAGAGQQYYSADGASAHDWNIASNTNLYANWTANTYMVTFNENDGSGSMEPESFTYDVAQALTSNGFKRVGYTFTGWARTAGGSVAYTDGQVVSNLTVTADSTVILYAKWTANKYTVTLDKQGGDGGTSIVTNTYDSTMQRINTPVRIGYTFGGYYAEVGGGGTQYYTESGNGVSEQKWDIASDATLYAKWGANSYTVAFDENGGSGTMQQESFTYGVAKALTSNAFNRDGYSFAGWATNSNGTAVYSDGQVVNNLTTAASFTLYATWTPNTYTVTLNANGGTVAPESVDVTYDEDWPALPTPNRDGYRFDGWHNDAECHAATPVDRPVAITSNTTIYAKWTPNTYTVEFNENGGSGTMGPESFTYDGAQALTSNDFKRVGYTFTGWATSASESVAYTDGQVVSNLTAAAGDTVTLYAKWAVNKYTVTLDHQGGTGGSSSVEATYDAAMPSAAMPTRTGYTFGGYYIKTAGAGQQYYLVDGTSAHDWNIASNATLYAKWTELRYIAFNGNDADNDDAMADDVMFFEGVETKVLVANKFEKTGYTFAGWATNDATAAALDVAYADCAEIVSTNLWMAAGETNVLYAVWQTNTYVVVFEPNGGWKSMMNQEFVYDQSQQLNPCEFAANLNFAGWATNSTGDVVFTNEETVVNLTAEANGIVTLYAVWDNGSLSEAMHCTNIAWTTTEGGTDWEIATGPYEGYNPSGSSVSNMIFWTGIDGEPYLMTKKLTFKPSTSGGMLSFWYKTSSADKWNDLYFNDEKIESSTEWRQYGPVYVDKFVGAKIYFTADKDYGEYNYTVWIDQMKWESYDCRIVFHPNGALGSMPNMVFDYTGDEIKTNLIACTFTNNVQKFCGWARTPNGDVEFDDEGEVLMQGAGVVDLYAKWRPISYTVTFDNNANAEVSGEMPPMSLTYGVSTNLTANAFVRNGYCFGGWATNAVGAKVYGDKDLIKNLTSEDGGEVVLYALWTPNTYTVAFNANGGVGEMGDEDYAYDVAQALTSNAFTRDGYIFAGWATSVSGSAEYSDGQVVSNLTTTASAVVDLYATWTPNTYTVAFDGNGGTGEMVGEGFAYGEEKALASNAFTCDGYIFAGWATSASGFAEYSDGQIVSNLTTTASAVVQLYATWTPKAYTVVLDANGGDGAMPGEDFAYDESKALTSNLFTRVGYTFAGWATNSTGTAVYIDGQVVSNLTAAASFTLYATWTANTYSVAFAANGGAGSMYDESFTYDIAQALTSNAFTRDGYIFAGWATSVSGSAEYSDGQVVSNLTTTASAVVDLYATWTPNTYTVAFDGNGGTGEMVGEGFAYGEEKPLPSNLFTREGYSFAGWATNDNGSVVYSDGQFVSNLTTTASAVIRLYATWMPNAYKVAFDENGGTGEMGDEDFVFDEEKALASNAFNRDGYTFAGWATSSNGTAVYIDGQVVSNLTTTASAVVDLYATWTPKVYAVTLNANGGTVAPESVDVTFDDDWPALPTPMRDGYLFGGWHNDAECQSATPTDSQVAMTSDATIYAKWTPIAYTVAFDANGGTGKMVDEDFVYDEEKALTSNLFNCDGYTFAGWATNSNGTAVYIDGQVVSNLTTTAGDTLTLYATWSELRYIAFNGNGADDDAMADDVMSFVGVETKTLVANKFEKIGYTFAGWATNDTTAAELAVAYTNCEAVVSTNLWMAAGETNVLYAVWIDQSGTVQRDCVIVFDPNGGTGSMPNMVLDHAAGKTNLIACAFENGGHEFLGWARTSDGPVEFDDKDEVSLQYAEVLRLYAKWKPIAVSSPSAREDLVYNGTGQIGVADGDGYVIVGNIATNAGSYTATATLEEGYVWADGTTDEQTIQWSITKATYDMSEITFSDKTFVADGTAKSIEISGTLPSGVTVSYAGNGQTEPGAYTVTATFTGDTGNYNSIPDKQATLTITKKSEPTPPDPGPGPVDPDPDPEPEKATDLYPSGVEALGAFTAEKAETYNGWLKDDDERIVALLTVKTTAAKSGKQTKSTITVTPVDGKKYTKKTTFYPGGNPTDEFGIVYGACGLLGTFGGYSVEAGVDVYKSKYPEMKALVVKIPVATYTFSIDTGNGMAVFSAVVAKTGKTKVQGYLEDGAKISVSTTGILGEDYFAIPVVSSKAASRCGFVLWLPLYDGSSTLANFYDLNWSAALSGGSYVMPDGEHVFDFDAPDYRDYLASVDGYDVAPVGAVFTVKGGKWDAGKTVGRLKVIDGVPTVTRSSSPSNLSALKLTYIAKSGLVKGSFKLYYMDGKRLKNDTVMVTGVVVDGKLFGSGTIKKLGSFAVVAE